MWSLQAERQGFDVYRYLDSILAGLGRSQAPHALPDLVRWFIELLPLTHTSYLLRGIGSGAEISLASVLVLLFYAVLGFVLGSRALLGLKK